MSLTVQKKCPSCGQPFTCKQQAGCWCAELRVDPGKLADLRGRFSGCLCPACLQAVAAQNK